LRENLFWSVGKCFFVLIVARSRLVSGLKDAEVSFAVLLLLSRNVQTKECEAIRQNELKGVAGAREPRS
jgi:hypothetical protein